MKENQDTLYSPNSKEDEAVKALEEELEDAVARYAQDNLLVVRVRKPFSISTELLSQVFLKDPYYQKMTRDLKMSGNAFFGAAGGWLFPTVVFPHCGFSLLCLSSLWLFPAVTFPHCDFSYLFSKAVGSDSVAGSPSYRCSRSDITASYSSLPFARAERCPM